MLSYSTLFTKYPLKSQQCIEWNAVYLVVIVETMQRIPQNIGDDNIYPCWVLNETLNVCVIIIVGVVGVVNGGDGDGDANATGAFVSGYHFALLSWHHCGIFHY